MSEDIRDLYESGKDFFDKGIYDKAKPLFEKVLDLSPYYADVHNKLGVIAELNGDKLVAAEYFRRALQINPNYTEAALNLSITYTDLGEPDQAMEVLEQIARGAKERKGELDPFIAGKLANEHFKLGNIYYDFTLYDEAIEQYQRAVQLRPGLPDINTRLGITLREQNRLEEAIQCLKAARKSNPSYNPARVHLGLTYYKMGELKRARKEWQEALDANPDDREARTFLNILDKKG